MKDLNSMEDKYLQHNLVSYREGDLNNQEVVIVAYKTSWELKAI